MPSAIGNALEQAISDFDKSIGNALLELFPDKLALMDIPDEDVKNIINDDGHNVATVLRCMRGSTALVSITDPSKSNLWVASLGDSAAGTQIGYSSEKNKGSTHALPFQFSERRAKSQGNGNRPF